MACAGSIKNNSSGINKAARIQELSNSLLYSIIAKNDCLLAYMFTCLPSVFRILAISCGVFERFFRSYIPVAFFNVLMNCVFSVMKTSAHFVYIPPSVKK